jgi:ABC-2 type transport system permease protein
VFIVLVAMPLLLILFVRPIWRYVLTGQGYAHANGAEQAVPGMAVMFAFFFVGSVGFSFFREHGWGTWDRLRASQARPAEIMMGKVAPLLLIAAAQQAVLFLAGAALFGLRIRGSIVALIVVAASFAVCLVAFSVAVVAVARSIQQVNLVQTLGTMLFAGLGGALAPTALLPGWARAMSPATPSYWALRGYRSVILNGGALPSVVLPAGALLAFAAGFTFLALWRFRFEETKVSWA